MAGDKRSSCQFMAERLGPSLGSTVASIAEMETELEKAFPVEDDPACMGDGRYPTPNAIR